MNQPLILPKEHHNKDNPFNGDYFSRRKTAEQLTSLLTRLTEGSVISIEAAWGDGKSWFGRNWAADLEQQEFKTIYLDAFENDYIDEPFVQISAEILKLLKKGNEPYIKIQNSAKKVLKAIAPTSAKVILNVATSGVFSETINQAIDDFGSTGKEWLETKLTEYEKDKESITKFKKLLEEYCQKQNKPVVFFIDELDRCNPVFSVKILERIKHFFEIKNLIFILLINKKELESAINGVYGSQTDSTTYLKKFIHLSFALPKNTSATPTDSNRNYLLQLLHKYQFNDQDTEAFRYQFSNYASNLNMSLRDIEKAAALFAMTKHRNIDHFYAWLIALKVSKPSIFYGIYKKNKEAHSEAAALLRSFIYNETTYSIQDHLIPLHMVLAGRQGELSNMDVERAQSLRRPSLTYSNSGDPFIFPASQIDLEIID